MKENLKNLKLINKKGGCMLRKVLSVLVICCFMVNNVCFAMPSIAGSNPTVDNIALQSAMQDGKTLSSGEMKNITAVFVAAAKNAAPGSEDFLNDQWKKNLESLGAKDSDVSAAEIKKLFSDAGIDVSFTDDKIVLTKGTGEGSVKQITVKDGQIELLNVTGFSGKNTEPANADVLVAQLNSNVKTNEAKAKSAKDNISAAMKEAEENGRLADVDADIVKAINDGLANQEVQFTEGIGYINESNWGVAHTVDFQTTMHDGFEDQATAQLLLYEILRGVGKTADESLAIARKVFGENVVAATTAEIKAKVAGETQKTATPEADVKIASSVIDLSKNNPTSEQKKEAIANIVNNSNLTEEQKRQINDVGVESGFNVIVTLATQAYDKLIAPLMGFMGDYSQAKLTTNETRPLQDAAKLNKDGKMTALTAQDIMTEQDVVSEAGMAYIEDLIAGRVQKGLSNIINMTAKQINQLQKQVKLFGGEADLIATHTGNDVDLAATLKDGQSLLFLYSPEAKNSLARTLTSDKATYVEIEDFNKGNSDILSAIVKAMNLKLEVKDGQLVGTMDKIEFDAAAYTKMKEVYTKIAMILIQA